MAPKSRLVVVGNTGKRWKTLCENMKNQEESNKVQNFVRRINVLSPFWFYRRVAPNAPMISLRLKVPPASLCPVP